MYLHRGGALLVGASDSTETFENRFFFCQENVLLASSVIFSLPALRKVQWRETLHQGKNLQENIEGN